MHIHTNQVGNATEARIHVSGNCMHIKCHIFGCILILISLRNKGPTCNESLIQSLKGTEGVANSLLIEGDMGMCGVAVLQC